MNRWLMVLIIPISLILGGCSDNGLPGEKPPKVSVEIANERYDTILGTYCWDSQNQSVCVDTVGPLELLQGKDPINVKPGAEIAFVMDYVPKPNETHFTQMNRNKTIDVKLINSRFHAPTEKGVYYYSYDVWWMDEKETNVSNGDASYVISLKVK